MRSVDPELKLKGSFQVGASDGTYISINLLTLQNLQEIYMSCLNSYLRCSHNLRGTFRVLNSRIGSKQNITIGDCASISGDENYLQLKVLYYGYLHIIFSSKYGITAIFRLSVAQNMVLRLSSHYLQLKIWYYGYLHTIPDSCCAATKVL